MRLLTSFSVLVLLAGTAFAQENSTPQKFNQDPVTSVVDKTLQTADDDHSTIGSQPALRTAMNDEIAQRRIAEQDAVAALVVQLEDTVSSEDRLALQSQITAAKQQGWRDMLAIQLKYAELGGHTEQAEKLRDRVTRLDDGLSPTQASSSSTRRDDALNNKGGK